MKIGIFDSGLGGLIIAKAIQKALPQYDYVYLGDTKRVPYGNRSHQTVFDFTRAGIDYLFQKENCLLVIVACNTASARALCRIQQEYLPKNFPLRKVLGVLIPTAEEAAKFTSVAVFGTEGTIQSNTFVNEINKLNKNTKVFQNSAPLLVPLAEAGEKELAIPFLKKYLKPFLGKSRRSSEVGPRLQASGKTTALVLGCTHYPFYKKEIKKLIDKDVKLLSQDEIVPKKLKEYLKKHLEIEKKLSKNKKVKILVTDFSKNIENLAQKWFDKKIKLNLIDLE